MQYCFIHTQFSRVNLGGLSNFQRRFSLRNTGRVQLQSSDSAEYYLGTSISKDLSNMRAYCSPQCGTNVKLDYSHVVSNNTQWRRGTSRLT